MPVDVFDILTTVAAGDGLEVHPALCDRAGGWAPTTLCRLPVRSRRPARSCPDAGCLRCALRAVALGIHAVRRADGVVVNLTRFVDARPEDC